MGFLISGLILMAATVVAAGLIFWFVARKKHQREDLIRNMAAMNGWSFERVAERQASGYRLRKGEWIIESLNQTSTSTSSLGANTEVASFTRWFSEAARMPEGMVLFGPRMPEIGFANMGNIITQTTLALLIGDQAKEAEGIHAVELGSIELMNRYMIWTNREEAAKKLLDPQVENALLNWPMKLVPYIKFSTAGLEIKLQSMRLYKESELAALVKLGNLLLDSAV